MGEKILLAVVLVLALYGCAELIRRVVRAVMSPSRGCEGVWVIPISGHREDVEYIVRAAAAQRGRFGGPKGRILLLDAGMDEETRRLAEQACRDVGTVDMIEENKLSGAAKDGLQESRL